MIEVSFIYKLKHNNNNNNNNNNNINYGKIVINKIKDNIEQLDKIIIPFIINGINLYRRTLKVHDISDIQLGILGVSNIKSSVNEKDIFNLYIIENDDNIFSYYMDGNLLN